mgnify:CR=1 FL=1
MDKNSHGKALSDRDPTQISLKSIVTQTITMIDQSKQQVYGIIEKNRSEYEQMKRDLERMKIEAEHIITQVDVLAAKDKLMRQKLAEMSKNFRRYSEPEVKAFYENASDIRIQYLAKQNEEKSLIERRSQLEISIRKFAIVIKDAEQVIHQVSIAMGYLQGEIFNALEDLTGKDKMLLGMRILEAQENERKRIARDIHDGPAQTMANVVMKADLCEYIAKKDLDKGLSELGELKEMVKSSLKEVRDIIFDLRPMSLDDLGLQATLERFVERLEEEKGLKVNLVVKKGPIEPEHIISVGMYRIVQEILNNIIKHAHATSVKMLLEFGTKYIRLVIINNGKGFNVNETLARVKDEGSSFGLLGMYERAEQLGGTLEISSSELMGSQFKVMLPINREVLKEKAEAEEA